MSWGRIVLISVFNQFILNRIGIVIDFFSYFCSEYVLNFLVFFGILRKSGVTQFCKSKILLKELFSRISICSNTFSNLRE
jgi:hypothetical protein